LENLTLTGTAALTGVGNSSANIIVGNSAANLIAGGLGNDTLTGGAGADTFLFNSAPGGANVDTITDFTAGSDKFAMQIAVFPQLQLATETVATARALDPTQFMLSTGVATAATRIIYNQTTGAVSYDSDGSGAAAPVQIAVIGNLPVLSASDFSLVL
jgi:Ca2+-binding RTX toxin-like protein